MSNLTHEDLIFTDINNQADNSNISAVLGTLEGPCADIIDSTRNGRKYSERLWEKVFNDPIVNEMLEAGGIPGELDHPTGRSETDSSRIAILLREKPYKKDGKLWAKFDILNTPLGKIAYTLAKAGFKLGVSSRGEGDVIDNYDGTESVDESTYDFKCFDLVLLPAVKSARLKLVTEGLRNKFDYKKALKESLEKATSEDRKIMQETLDNLDIKLTESSDTLIYDKDIVDQFKDYFDVSDPQDVANTFEKSVLLYDRVYYPKTDGLSENNEEKKLYINNDADDTKCECCEAALNIIQLIQNIESSKTTSEDDKDAIHNYLLLVYDNILNHLQGKIDINTNFDINSFGVPLPVAVDNTEAAISEFQEALKENRELAKTITKLQEKLSVSYAKEARLLLKIDHSDQVNSKLKVNAKEVKGLNQTIRLLLESLVAAQKSSELNYTKHKKLAEKYNLLIDSGKELKANIAELQQVITRLTEKLSKLKADSFNKINELNESISSLRKQLNSKDQEYQNKYSKYSKKLTDSNKLIEQYKSMTNKAVNRYIDSRATMIGTTSEEIKKRLPESYNFNDIDNVCENLRNYKLNMSKLPFRTSEKLNESVQVRATSVTRDPILPAVGIDDDVDAQLQSLAGLI